MEHNKNICDDFKEKNCCGCGVCINSCPTGALSYGENKYGFIVPKIDRDKCIHCGRCIHVCPFIVNSNECQRFHFPLVAYAAKNNNDTEVFKSTSGGIFIVLAKQIIIEGGIVVGCMMDHDYQVKHVIISDSKDLSLLQKSKYVQSYMGNIYKKIKQHLIKREKVLFSGTPCELAALIKFLDKTDTSMLYLVDVVCHGVPNQQFFNDYLVNLHREGDNLGKYTFRAKFKANNGMNWFFSFQMGNHYYIRNWPEDSFNYYYMKAATYRESCYHCRFAQCKRVSDITLCDYWNWEKYHSDVFALNATVSGVLINTIKGEKLFDSIKHSLMTITTNLNQIVDNNGCLRNPSVCPPERQVILSLWKSKGYRAVDTLFRKKYKKQIWKYRIMRHIPMIVSTMFHRMRK